jgi:hypothetical protein
VFKIFRSDGRRRSQGSRKGQGVVEYAGALVIAATIVATAMFVVPDQVASLINDVVTAAISYFTSQLPA